MRLARFQAQGDQRRVGVVENNALSEVSDSWVGALERATASPSPALARTGRVFPLSEVTFLPPLPDGDRPLFCVGLNYREHVIEARDDLRAVPTEHPVFFAKLPQTMVGASDQVVLDPGLSRQFDWEVELGVVIGRAGRMIAPSDVAGHLAGYTIVNDVTARDLQRQHTQWFAGKNVHTTSPMGPWVTTIDEAGYPPALEMVLTVNGQMKQKVVTSELIFDIATLVATLSRGIQLQPGDVISTGTPMGVGFARQPPEFLQAGDLMEAQIEKLGRQRNAVAAPSAAPSAAAADAREPA